MDDLITNAIAKVLEFADRSPDIRDSHRPDVKNVVRQDGIVEQFKLIPLRRAEASTLTGFAEAFRAMTSEGGKPGFIGYSMSTVIGWINRENPEDLVVLSLRPSWAWAWLRSLTVENQDGTFGRVLSVGELTALANARLDGVMPTGLMGKIETISVRSRTDSTAAATRTRESLAGAVVNEVDAATEAYMPTPMQDFHVAPWETPGLEQNRWTVPVRVDPDLAGRGWRLVVDPVSVARLERRSLEFLREELDALTEDFDPAPTIVAAHLDPGYRTCGSAAGPFERRVLSQF